MIRLDNISLSEAMRYMGCSPDTDDTELKARLEKYSNELLLQIRPLYTYKIFDIEQCDNGIEIKGTSLVLTGNSIKQHLADCQQIILFAATLSLGADRFIQTAQLNDMAKALMADALCSAAIEQVCELATEKIKAELNADIFMTWRFSPGYGDLPLDIQPQLLRMLNADKTIGLTVNDSLIMLPRKSVTAIIGLSDKPIEQKRLGCTTCNINKTCNFRKRGVRCDF